MKLFLLGEKESYTQELERAIKTAQEALCEPNSRPKNHPADTNNFPDINLSGRIPTLNKLIRKADEALKRLDQGTYGICEDCGESIPLARLQVVPFTNRCVSCKAEAESDDTIIVNGTPRRISHLTRKTITLP